jgi:hypothetical protein
MLIICKTILITICLVVSTSLMQAQITLVKLNQVELIRQFTGSWKTELGKDTIVIGENKPFGTGLICNSQILIKGIVVDSVIQLYGYDKNADRFIIEELIKSSPVVEICSAWFTSVKTGELIITNPENIALKFKFEFKTPDIIIQTALKDNTVYKIITITRIKK